MNKKLLTKQEQKIVKNIALDFYSTHIKNKSFKCQKRLFGIEIEFSLIKPSGEFAYEYAEILYDHLSTLSIIPEFGSFQIEINPEPLTITNTNFKKLYYEIQKIKEKINGLCEDKNIALTPIGIPFYIDPNFYKNNKYITNKQRYLISSQYFNKYNPNGSSLEFDKSEINLPGNASISIINELHIHIQALNNKDLLDLFNYSQMISAPFISLGANSGITNGKELTSKEYQICLFEQAEGLYDGPPTIPRVGLYPGYLTSINDFFESILSFTPLYYEKDMLKSTAFEFFIGKYFGWTRIRVSYDQNNPLRIEFRPLSTQPTLLENIALSEFYIKTLQRLINEKINFIPSQYLQINFNEAKKYAMNAMLFWDFGNGLKKYPVCEILESFIENIKHGQYTHIIKNRIHRRLSPTEKIIKETKMNGYKTAIRSYMNSTHNENPYV